jgi:RNA polymerase sigma-70 factor (ECF subfamily)
MGNNHDLSDEKLIEKIRSSDQELYSLIVERYQNKLLRYAVGLIHDEDLAADIVQESFIKAFVNLKGFNTKKKFSSWIYRIVHNEAINTIKRYQKEIQLPEGIDFRSDEDVEKDFEKKEGVEEVKKCLAKMPQMYSEPLALFYIDERSYGEISDILRIPMGTVAVRINRAKTLMKKLCQKN